MKNIDSKNYVEYYHDAVEHHEDLYTLFNLGYLALKERAIAEEYFKEICLKVLTFSEAASYQPEELAALKKINETKYLANFSIFQSIPDAWSIGQLFPILPLSRHDEKTSHKANIVDITCDSDGCIERFVDKRGVKSVIDLHKPDNKPYYLGFFLVGAYQESLSNEHNLFGAINEVEVVQNEDGSWYLSKTTEGDLVKELLTCRNYDMEEMKASYQKQLEKQVVDNFVSEERAKELLDSLTKYLDCYPYLKEKE